MRISALIAVLLATAAVVASPAVPASRGIVVVVSAGRLTVDAPKGTSPSNLPPGEYVLTVRDRSNTDNFHLLPRTRTDGHRRTGVRWVGTKTWRIYLVPGAYRYRSDSHASSLTGVLKVRAAAGIQGETSG